MSVRAFVPEDFPAWQTLWDQNNRGFGGGEVTATTWKRLMDSQSPVYGLGYFAGGELVGFVHYILHPTTGHIEPACYMQDLFVDPAHRQKGIARSLVTELARIARQEKWSRFYWLAEAENESAQALYKSMGVKLNFTFHVMPVATTP